MSPPTRSGPLARHQAALAPLATADPWYGAALMFAFRLGTLPDLLAIGALFGYTARRARSRAARAVFAMLIVGMGVFNIVRATHPLAHAAGTFSLSGKILAGDQT